MQTKKLYNCRYFRRYLWESLSASGIYRWWHRGFSYFRRFRAVALTVKIVSFVFTFFQTGTFVLLGTLLFLIFLPLLVLGMLGVTAAALVQSRRTDRIFTQILSSSTPTYILFLNELPPTPYATWNIRDLSARGTVLLVSPYWLSPKGIFQKGGFYTAARQEEKNIFLLRKYYFFHLRRKIFEDKKTVYLF